MIYILITLFIIIGITYFFIPTNRFTFYDEQKWGVTYSKEYATALGLDWKDTYKKMLQDFNFKVIRIPVYWNDVEKEQGIFDFTDIEWQIEQAKQKNIDVILAVGYKLPRWPECRKPDWLGEEPEKIQKSLLMYIEKTVNTFKNNGSVTLWQVENEPYLNFGECITLEKDFVKKEIDLVKSLDSKRDIMITDSGELNLWNKSSKSGADVLGVTTYRRVHNKYLGYFDWRILTPAVYRKKTYFINERIKDVYGAELQLEVWAPDFIDTMTLKEQIDGFDEDDLRKNIEFGEKQGFSHNLIWGVEWWYYLAQKHKYTNILDEAKFHVNKACLENE